jgi:oligopeptide/dipeptide ABC transporter ATP-binding protein
MVWRRDSVRTSPGASEQRVKGQSLNGQGSSGEPLLSVRELSVAFAEDDGSVVRAVDGVSFDVSRGQAVGLVGESGCGKSVTLRTLVGLQEPGRVLAGTARLDGRDLLRLSKRELDQVRGGEIAMVFQDAGGALTPVLSVGRQLTEVLRTKRRLSTKEARQEAIRLLERVDIAAAAERMHAYPHQLSGGMRQRVMIALALAGRPLVLLADEPTTALDVTIQDQILALLAHLRREEHLALVLVSHDLELIAQECEYVAVMYAGHIVEYGPIDAVLDFPRHPYTEALLNSILPAKPQAERTLLRSIRGQPPELAELPSGCAFRTRCLYAQDDCETAPMTLDRPLPEHGSACIHPERVGETAE